jgi:phage N-6-adenine-methyltransferase
MVNEMSHERKDGLTHLKDEARTPPALFKRLDERFCFDCDAAATEDNTLCNTFFARHFSNKENPLELHKIPFETDAITADWCSHLRIGCRTFYCNPPYSRGNIDKFVAKAYSESLKGAIVVMLLPADVSTAWFRDYCMMAAEWIIIKGKVHFNNPDGTPMIGSPKFGSIAVVFDAEARRKHGLVVSEMDWR